MKEAHSMRQAYSSSRDLGVLLEENENNVPMSQSSMSYLDQVLDPALPNSLSFLRGLHTKAGTASIAAYHRADIPTTSSMESAHTPLPMRRARAGTMPSLGYIPDERSHRSPLMRPTVTSSTVTSVAAVDTRHRSGSLNLPIAPPMHHLSFDNPMFGSSSASSSWSTIERDNSMIQQQQVHSSLPSPSTEQLLRGDSDNSIARTLRLMGLEDDRATPMGDMVNMHTTATSNGMFHHIQQQAQQHHLHQQQEQQQHITPTAAELHHIPAGRSLLSANRNRSYSVNAAARYQDPTPSASIHVSRSRASSVSRSYANPLDNLNVHRNRPRAASMGRMDYGRSVNPPISSSLWKLQRVPLETLADDESDYQSQGYAESLKSNHQAETVATKLPLSLGDSELLANMLQKQVYAVPRTVADEQQEALNGYRNGNGQAAAEPYLHFSQSTPTFRSPQAQLTPSASSPTQAATRSLWIGNIDATVSVENLTQMFISFGPIESVRLLLEKECAFVNFFHVEDAVRAKEEVLGRLGGRIGNCIVRIGFGRADAVVPDTTALQPTRALWLGNIPPGTAPSTLQHMFASFGPIESVRVLSHKNCGFVNFEQVESAAKAREALLQNEIGAQGFAGVRVGFAKVPPVKSTNPDNATTSNHGSKSSSSYDGNERTASADNETWLSDLWSIMLEFGADEQASSLVKALETSSSYFESIPPVPEFGVNRKFDANRLREIRKKLDAADRATKEVENIAYDCMDEIAELSSDYIGNTVVQRLFEKCTEDTKTAMLERIAPHLAAISIHKNGTWAAQKIIDTIKTPAQIHLVCTHLKPYVPPLLLDQFGNYAVQCCLRLGEVHNQFIFDAMVEKLLNVAQGRFGARAMRGILENQHVTRNQQIFVSAALAQNAASLAMNANGALLLSWLMDSSNIENRHSLVANRLSQQMVQIGTHKLGSQMLLKLINQENDPVARETILKNLTNEKILEDILADQTRGVSLIQKVMTNSHLSASELQHLNTIVRPILSNGQIAGHKKLLDELMARDNNKKEDDDQRVNE